MFSKQVTEQYLYHYVSLETAIEKILYSGKIRLGPFEQTNDPREYQEWGISSIGGSEDTSLLFKLLDLVNEDRLKFCKVLCFTKDDMKYSRLGYGRRGFARARMWAQYAGRHRGICLIFDTDKLDTEINKTLENKGKIFKGMVDYTDSMDGVEAASTFNLDNFSESEIKSAIKQHIDKYAKTLFFNKNRDWKDETEYRYVFYSDDNCDPQFVSINTSLKGLVLGDDLPEAYYPVIDYFKGRYGLEVGCMCWNNGIPHIRPFEFL